MTPPVSGDSGPSRIDWAALCIAAGLLVIAAVIAWDTYHLPLRAGGYSSVGPRPFPYGVATCLAALGIATVVSAFRKLEFRPGENYGPLFWIVGGLMAQIAILPFGGFSLATGAVFAATAKGFGRGPLWFTYPVGVLLALFIWTVFANGLNLILPSGPVEDFLEGLLRQ